MPDPRWVLMWLQAFGLTELIEVPIATWLLGGAGEVRTSDANPPLWRRAVVALLASLATHPMVWFVWPLLPLPWHLVVAVAETWAVGIETVVYAVAFPAMGWRRAFGISLAANGASFGIGLLLAQAGWLW